MLDIKQQILFFLFSTEYLSRMLIIFQSIIDFFDLIAEQNGCIKV